MFEKLKLRMARHQLAAARQDEEHYRNHANFLRDTVLPELEQRVEAAELAVLGENYQSALADPRTPAYQSRRLVELAMRHQPHQGI